MEPQSTKGHNYHNEANVMLSLSLQLDKGISLVIPNNDSTNNHHFFKIMHPL